jgi:serine phosphatase RsbU (regulator of sigma subunit)/Tfp pilus assembly protein PilF
LYIYTIKIIIYILLFLISFQGIAQTFADKEYYLIDSLVLEELIDSDKQLIEKSLKLYHAAENDTSKINALNDLCENMMDERWIKYQFFQYLLVNDIIPTVKNNKIKRVLNTTLSTALNNIGYYYSTQGSNDKALKYYLKSLNIHKDIDDKQGMATSLNNIGLIYFNQGNIPKTLEYLQNSLDIRKEINDQEGIANSLINIGSIYDNQGNIAKTLEYYHKSLAIREETGDKEGIANSLSNIGVLYNKQGDISIALDYFNKSLAISETIGDKEGIATSLNNIGDIYKNQGDISKALKYHLKGLVIQEEIGDKNGIATSLNNIAMIYFIQGNITKTLEFNHKSLAIQEEIGNKKGIATSLTNIGILQLDLGNLLAAKENGLKSLIISQEIGYPHKIIDAADLLSKVYEKQGEGMKAFEMSKLIIVMRDSVNNADTRKAAAMQQAKYEYEKQKAIDDAEYNKLLIIEEEKKEKQQILTSAITVCLGLVVVFLIFLFNRLKATKKQKLVIEHAHEELGEKNKRILDSITYAKRIQSAILPPDNMVKEYLPKSFILYKPKDIVAGDFYWLEAVNPSLKRGLKVGDNHPSNSPQGENIILFAAADCTGHGVPGAMVSVVCNNALNRSVREYGLTDPGQILDKTREIVVAEFEKSEEDVKDGMDIALCSLEGNKLQYAGAHNPLWIIRNGVIIETKANKQPIGQFDNPEPYTTHSFDLEAGDSIYIFSDGYVDQFGGEKGKKFKSNSFRELLLSIQHKAMEEQKTIIDESFESWRGDLEQIDDVCIIGVRI